MPKTICFVANYYKTIFFYEIAKRLEVRGVQTVWISPGRRWASWLEGKGIPPSRILVLADYGDEWSSVAPLTEAERSELTTLEEDGIGDTFYNVVARDRVLRNKPLAYALRYMLVSARRIEAFLREHDVRHIFGEKTWAHELLISIIAARLGVADFCPHTIRVPSGRFGFFLGQDQSQLLEIREPSAEDFAAADKVLMQLAAREIKPHYFYLNQGLPPLRPHWVGELLRTLGQPGQSRYDETLPGIGSRISARLIAYGKAAMVSMARPFDPIPTAGRFILVTLHKQPESSVDVLAARCSNQLEAIRALSRSIPASHEIWVKEHSNAIGDRSVAWYRDLKDIPGVRLIDPYADTFSLMSRADAVIAPSGTVCLEAGLLGIPAATFSDMFFNPVLTGNNINPYSLSREKVMALLESRQTPEKKDHRRFLAWLHAQSFEGRIADPVHDLACMDQANLDRVTEAFTTILTTESYPMRREI